MGGEADQSRFLKKLERNIRKAIKRPSEEEAEYSHSGSGSSDSEYDSSYSSDSEQDTDSDANVSSVALDKHCPLLLWVPYSLERGIAGRHTDLDVAVDTFVEIDQQTAFDEMEEDEALDKAEQVAAKKEEKSLWRQVREAKPVEIHQKKMKGKKRKRELELETVNITEKVQSGEEARAGEVVDEVDEEKEGRYQFKSARYVVESDEEKRSSSHGDDKEETTKAKKPRKG